MQFVKRKINLEHEQTSDSHVRRLIHMLLENKSRLYIKIICIDLLGINCVLFDRYK